MSYIEVKNKKGTADNPPPSGYSSWLDYWEKKKGQKATKYLKPEIKERLVAEYMQSL